MAQAVCSGERSWGDSSTVPGAAEVAGLLAGTGRER